MNIPIETSLPVSPTDGDIILLRLGSSPYEFLLLVYDGTYGKWVSHAMPISGNAAEVGITTTSSTHVVGPTMKIPNYKLFYDAGMRLQARVTGAYQNNNTGGTATVRAVLTTGVVDGSSNTERGTTTGATSPGGTTAVLHLASGWQDFSSGDPSTDTIGQISMRLIRNTAGTAFVGGNRQMWLRWVSA